jgi:hypothetical protein
MTCFLTASGLMIASVRSLIVRHFLHDKGEKMRRAASDRAAF